MIEYSRCKRLEVSLNTILRKIPFCLQAFEDENTSKIFVFSDVSQDLYDKIDRALENFDGKWKREQ